ncbi:MAG: pentapeptide repeat-containing protein [Flavobacteriaceae bacterium]|jgi:hypothetical protein|nr:pentapeptide repeat-containing protein [Flavobacteriaceae bacterium]
MNETPEHIERTKITAEQFEKQLLAGDYDFSNRIFEFNPRDIFAKIYFDKTGKNRDDEYEEIDYNENWLKEHPIFIFDEDADFSNVKFSGRANFKGAEFSGEAVFMGAKFSEFTDFIGAKFSGYADFSEAEFPGYAYFSGAKFSESANFNRAEFSGYVYFNGAEFSRFARFNRAEFLGNANLSGVKFSEYAYFIGAKFSGEAYFSGAEFSGNADFIEAKFSGFADFSGAKFSINADSADLKERIFIANFSNAEFSGNANFNGAKFSGNAYFVGAEFLGYANFIGAEFSGDTGFHYAKFSGNADFDGAEFSGNADFGEAEFSGGVYFSGAKFSGNAIFGNMVLNVFFALENTNINYLDFSYSPESNFTLITDGLKIKKAYRSVYTLFKKKLHEQQDYIESKRFHALEMNAEWEYITEDKELKFGENWIEKLKKRIKKINWKFWNWNYSSLLRLDWWLISLNRISNNHGTSWARGIVFTIVAASVSMFFLSRCNNWHFDYSRKGVEFFLSYFSNIFNIASLFSKDNDYSIQFSEEHYSIGLHILFLIFRILTYYGIYQTIAAFRKYKM